MEKKEKNDGQKGKVKYSVNRRDFLKSTTSAVGAGVLFGSAGLPFITPRKALADADIIKIGQAYRKMGEHERALQVYRATAEASFVKDTAVAGDLNGQGEVLVTSWQPLALFNDVRNSKWCTSMQQHY